MDGIMRLGSPGIM